MEQGGSREAALAEDYTAIGDVQAIEMTGDAETEAAAAEAYSKAAYAFLTFLQSMGEQAGETLDAESGIQNVDMNRLYAMMPMLAQLPPAQIESAMQEAENAQSMIGSQVGTSFTGLFYRELGLDMEAKQQDYIVMKGLEMLGVALLGVAAAILVGFFASRISAAVGRQMRRDVFQKVESFSNTEFDHFSTDPFADHPHDERRHAGADADLDGPAADVLRADHGHRRHYLRAAEEHLAELDHRARRHRPGLREPRDPARRDAEVQAAAEADRPAEPRQPRKPERPARRARVLERGL